MHNIKLTTAQFKTLLKLVYIGEWIVNSHQVEPIVEFDSLSRYLFSLTKDFKIPAISIEEEPEFPTNDYEGEVRKYIEEYDELTFWDELSEKLTQKMLVDLYTQDQIKSMDRIDRFKIWCDIEEKVKNHLQHIGLDQIVIK